MQKIINSGKSQLTIDTLGGKIVELVVDGAKILGSFPRIDGKVGATHICTPNFAGEGMTEFGLPFHGPARNMAWQVVNESEKMIEIKVTIEALEKYKTTLDVYQYFELIENEFIQKVSVINTGRSVMPVNIGIHNYFHTPNGWHGTKLNGNAIDEKIMKNLSVKIADIADSAEKISTLEIPEAKTLIIKTQGAADFVTWTGVKEGKYDNKYVCIEPVCWFDTKFFGTSPSLLKSGETRIVTQTISLH